MGDHDQDIGRSVLRELAQDLSADDEVRLSAASQLMLPDDVYSAPDYGLAADELADKIVERLRRKGVHA